MAGQSGVALVVADQKAPLDACPKPISGVDDSGMSDRGPKMLTTTDEGCAYIRRHRLSVVVQATEPCGLYTAV